MTIIKGDKFIVPKDIPVVLNNDMLGITDELTGETETINRIDTQRSRGGVVTTNKKRQYFVDDIKNYIIQDEYINLPEAKLPAPMRKKPKNGQVYYVFDPFKPRGHAFVWGNEGIDNIVFETGIFDEEWKVQMWVDYLRSAKEK